MANEGSGWPGMNVIGSVVQYASRSSANIDHSGEMQSPSVMNLQPNEIITPSECGQSTVDAVVTFYTHTHAL